MSKQSKRGRGKGLREGSQGSPLGPRIQSPIGNPIASNLASSDGQHGGSISSGSLQRGLIAETGGSGHGQKMAIPALKTSSGFDSQGRHKKGRTKHACDSCRQAKSGCTGDQPCKRCRFSPSPSSISSWRDSRTLAATDSPRACEITMHEFSTSLHMSQQES